MKNFCCFCLLLFFISCSNNDSLEQEPAIENDSLEITYRGFYQVFFGEPYQNEVYNRISVTPITEQISPTETIDLLKINAYSNEAVENYITFKVKTNSTGNTALYNNDFSFRSYGATYFSSNFNFEVLKNNDSEFSANFSGVLEHWYEGEMRYVYMDITLGSISMTY